MMASSLPWRDAFPPVEAKSLGDDILRGLKLLHTFKIVHQGIKPTNIAWSENQQKWVFLDFGFARCLKKEPGEKTKTKFIGTYRYTSVEMQKTYHLDHGMMVDLYYNDLHSSKVTINTIKDSLEDEAEEEEEDKAHYIYSRHLMYGRHFRKLSTEPLKIFFRFVNMHYYLDHELYGRCFDIVKK